MVVTPVKGLLSHTERFWERESTVSLSTIE